MDAHCNLGGILINTAWRHVRWSVRIDTRPCLIYSTLKPRPVSNAPPGQPLAG